MKGTFIAHRKVLKSVHKYCCSMTCGLVNSNIWPDLSHPALGFRAYDAGLSVTEREVPFLHVMH
jgi:hypothetical protein